MNLYGFAGGDPVNFSDPLGLSGCQDKERKEKESCEKQEQERQKAKQACKADVAQFGLGLATNVLGIGAYRYLKAGVDVTRTARAADVARRAGTGLAAATAAEQRAAGAFIGNAMYYPSVAAISQAMSGAGAPNPFDGSVALLCDIAKVAPVIGAGLELGEAIRSCGSAIP